MRMILIGKKATKAHVVILLVVWLHGEVFEHISESNTKLISIKIKCFHFQS